MSDTLIAPAFIPPVSAVAPRGKLVLASAAYSPAQVITAVAPNPKKPGTEAHRLYALYVPGMSVAAYVKAAGTRGATCIRWDLARGFITLA
jgi:hypothetical protein